jgi:hypothetical protein
VWLRLWFPFWPNRRLELCSVAESNFVFHTLCFTFGLEYIDNTIDSVFLKLMIWIENNADSTDHPCCSFLQLPHRSHIVDRQKTMTDIEFEIKMTSAA